VSLTFNDFCGVLSCDGSFFALTNFVLLECVNYNVVFILF